MYYERKISMKLDSSTLFVNTGRKPLPAMQKKKKDNKNTVALIVCIAIIAVLCVFVGLILHVWFNYNEEVAPRSSTQVTTEKKQEEMTQKPKVEKPKEQKPKEEEAPKTVNKTQGDKSPMSSAAEAAFASLDATYSFGIVNLNDGYTYINNTDRIENSAALGAFLMEYASNAIYIGTFDYSTDVAGHFGRDLMTRAFSQGSVEAANLLIQHFGVEKLNAYFEQKGYANTKFSGTIGDGSGCYTTAEDLTKLMQKMYNNTTFFPYSDMYKKMTVSTVDTKIAAALPSGTSVANIGFDAADETFDAAIVYTPSGNFIFVAMAEGDGDAAAAMSKAASDICAALTKTSGADE